MQTNTSFETKEVEIKTIGLFTFYSKDGDKNGYQEYITTYTALTNITAPLEKQRLLKHYQIYFH